MSTTHITRDPTAPALLRGLEVCFLAGTLGHGGAERQLCYITRALLSSGSHVRVLSLTQGELYENTLRNLGAEVTWVGQTGNKLVRLWRIFKALKNRPARIVHSQHFYTNLYAMIAGRQSGTPHLGSMRSNGRSEVKAAGKVLGNLSLKKPAALVANTRIALQFAEEQGVPSRQLYYLPNAIDTHVFQPAFRPPRSQFRVIAVGRLAPEKRFDRFLRIIAALKNDLHVPVEAWIVGSGPLRAQLEQQAWDLGLTGTVRFRGAMEDMMLVYPEADALVLTSDFEGTPNVLIEAMATGLPVVATRVGGIPEVISDGRTGFLADPNDEAGMIQSLHLLAGSAELRMSMGEAGIRWVEEHYSLKALPQRLAEIYSDVMTRQVAA